MNMETKMAYFKEQNRPPPTPEPVPHRWEDEDPVTAHDAESSQIRAWLKRLPHDGVKYRELTKAHAFLKHRARDPASAEALADFEALLEERWPKFSPPAEDGRPKTMGLFLSAMRDVFGPDEYETVKREVWAELTDGEREAIEAERAAAKAESTAEVERRKAEQHKAEQRKRQAESSAGAEEGKRRRQADPDERRSGRSLGRTIENLLVGVAAMPDPEHRKTQVVVRLTADGDFVCPISGERHPPQLSKVKLTKAIGALTLHCGSGCPPACKNKSQKIGRFSGATGAPDDEPPPTDVFTPTADDALDVARLDLAVRRWTDDELVSVDVDALWADVDCVERFPSLASTWAELAERRATATRGVPVADATPLAEVHVIAAQLVVLEFADPTLRVGSRRVELLHSPLSFSARVATTLTPFDLYQYLEFTVAWVCADDEYVERVADGDRMLPTFKKTPARKALEAYGRVQLPTFPKGHNTLRAVVELFHNHLMYDRRMFEPRPDRQPDVLNEFVGYQAELHAPPQTPGERARAEAGCRLFENHLLVLCDGLVTCRDYLLDWLAHHVQHPTGPIGAMPTISGVEGLGKSEILRIALQALLGEPLVWYTSDVGRDLFERFNDHMQTVLVVLLDETQRAGVQHKQADRLKSQVTARKRPTEAKYGRRRMDDCYAGFMAFTNHTSNLLDVTKTDRRYFLVRGWDGFKAVHPPGYYRALVGCFAEGCVVRHLFDRLRARDLSRFDPEQIPMTALRAAEMDNSRGLVDRFFAEWLEGDAEVTGAVPLANGGEGVTANALYEDIERWRERTGHYEGFGWSAKVVRDWAKAHGLYAQRRVDGTVRRVVVLDHDKIAGAVALPEGEEETLPFSALRPCAEDDEETATKQAQEVSARVDTLLAEIRADVKTLK